MINDTINKSCCENTYAESTVEDLCPVCGKKGTMVENFTVKHIVSDDLREQIGEDDYFLCMSDECDITYYNPKTEVQFNKKQLSVPIWYKKDAHPKYSCYCSKVTEEQVINAVLKEGASTMQEVLNITGAMKNANCRKNNPLGKCCHQVIQVAIDKGLSMK